MSACLFEDACRNPRPSPKRTKMFLVILEPRAWKTLRTLSNPASISVQNHVQSRGLADRQHEPSPAKHLGAKLRAEVLPNLQPLLHEVTNIKDSDLIVPRLPFFGCFRGLHWLGCTAASGRSQHKALQASTSSKLKESKARRSNLHRTLSRVVWTSDKGHACNQCSLLLPGLGIPLVEEARLPAMRFGTFESTPWVLMHPNGHI